jgi:hypothetical protein
MRTPGYYWVKVYGKWTIGEFRVISDVFTEWHILLERWSEKELIENNDLTDTGIEEIDENRIERKDDSKETEHWSTVTRDIADVFGNPNIEKTCRDDGGPALITHK